MLINLLGFGAGIALVVISSYNIRYLRNERFFSSIILILAAMLCLNINLKGHQKDADLDICLQFQKNAWYLQCRIEIEDSCSRSY